MLDDLAWCRAHDEAARAKARESARIVDLWEFRRRRWGREDNPVIKKLSVGEYPVMSEWAAIINAWKTEDEDSLNMWLRREDHMIAEEEERQWESHQDYEMFWLWWAKEVCLHTHVHMHTRTESPVRPAC